MNRKTIVAIAVLGVALIGLYSDEANAQTGACCTAGACTEEMAATCTGGGGFYVGDGTLCGSTDCTVGACCNGGLCSEVSAAQCESEGGFFAGGGTVCVSTDCNEGACCINGQCVIQTALECTGGGGTYEGDATTCPATCTIACKDIDEIRATAEGTVTKTCSKVIVSLLDTTASGSNRGFTIQDTSGVDMSGPGGANRGLLIFGFDSDFGVGTEWDDFVDTLSEGDTVDVQGDLTSFAGVLEFVPRDLADISVTGTAAVPSPIVITAADLTDGAPTAANLQSTRVTIECVSFTASGNFAGGTDYEITDGVDTLTGKVRIVTNEVPLVGTQIPFGPVNLTGVHSEFFGNLQMNLESIDAASSCAAPTGRCCYPDGSCAETVEGLCTQGGTFELGVDCTPNDCPLPTGGCCNGGFCTIETQPDCENAGGAWKGTLTDCFLGCPDITATRINEIRIDQLSSDNSEYFELIGPPGGALGNLTYIVIGDGAGGSGTIEAVVPLNATQIPADGIFVAVEASFDIGMFPVSTDLVTSMNFENGDNVTHMLVSGFTGANGDDVDTDDDCVIDPGPPWTAVIDSIAIILEDNTLVNTECHYGPPQVGPDGAFVPGHVLRCDDAPVTPWQVGEFDIAIGIDTPGGPNDCTQFVCGTCPGDINGDDDVAFDDAAGFVDAILGITPNPCADVNQDSNQDGADVNMFVSLIIGSGGLSPTPCVDVTLTRCDAGGDGSCVAATDFCLLQGNFTGCSTVAPDTLVCVQCDSGVCFEEVGPLVFGRIVDGDGVGMDCTFIGSLADDQCLPCGASTHRFKVVP